MRGSDPDAAVYWLMRMLEAGEDPLFVARRMVIFAAEDVGNADPQALQVAVAAKDAVHFVGLPEGRIPLAQAATLPGHRARSRTPPIARMLAAAEDVRAHGAAARAAAPAQRADAADEGPRLRRAATEYPHDHADAVVEQDYLPDALARPALLRADRPRRRARDRASGCERGAARASPAPATPDAVRRHPGFQHAAEAVSSA